MQEKKKITKLQKNKYHTDPFFRTKKKDYMINKYWTEPELREKSLARGKAWCDARSESIFVVKGDFLLRYQVT